MYILLLSPLFLILFFSFLEKLSLSEDQFSFGFIICLGLIFIHFTRKDFGFLNLLDVPKYKLFWIEYNFIGLIFSIVFLLLGSFTNALIVHLGASVIALFPQGTQRSRRFFPELNWLPTVDFEWKTGWRKYFIGLLLLYIPFLFLGHYIASVLLLGFFMMIFVMAFYEYYEPKEVILNLIEKEKFLFKKSLRGLLFFHGLMLPHYYLFLSYHFQYWYFLLYSFVATSFMLLFVIFYKYAKYSPFREKLNGQTVMALFSISVIIPFLLPLAFGIILYQFGQATQNLNQFANAKN